MSSVGEWSKVQIVNYTRRRLIRARINDCHRRLNHYKNKQQQRLDRLKQLIPPTASTDLLSTIQTIADKRAYKTETEYRNKHQRKLERLQHTKTRKRGQKRDDDWVKNISSRQLDETETQVLSYGLKHSITPRRIPIETIHDCI